MRGFTLIELIIATTLSLLIALSVVQLLSTSFKAMELYKRKINERKLNYLIYIIQKQLIGCHNIEFKAGLTYTTSNGLTEGFVRVFFDASKEGILYREHDTITGKPLYTYKLPVEATFLYDGRKTIKLSASGKEFNLFILCADSLPMFIGK